MLALASLPVSLAAKAIETAVIIPAFLLITWRRVLSGSERARLRALLAEYRGVSAA
jgi:hypothetical protein